MAKDLSRIGVIRDKKQSEEQTPPSLQASRSSGSQSPQTLKPFLYKRKLSTSVCSAAIAMMQTDHENGGKRQFLKPMHLKPVHCYTANN